MPGSFDEAFPEGFDECVRTLSAEDSVDDPEKLCGWLQENGFEAIQSENPNDVLASLEVEYVSVVDEPAQDSEWLVAKSAQADSDEFDPAEPSLRDGEFVVNKQSEDPERKVWAAVLIPDETDKQGDLVPRPEIERAAHTYLKHYRKVDEDHDLVDGSGEPIESYVLKQETTFNMPDGSGERTYPEGTWIMGVELTDEAWKRVESGELSGFSIYGGAASLEPDELLTSKQKEVLLNMQDGDGETVEKQPEDDPCWDNYVMVGFKTDEFGNEVPNCVPEEDAEAMSSVVASLGPDGDLSDDTLQAGATALSAVVGKELSPEDLSAAMDEFQNSTGQDPTEATLVEFVEFVEEFYAEDSDADSDEDDEGTESDGMDDEQESSKESETTGNGGDSDGGSGSEQEKENMGDEPDDGETEEQNDKLDELLEKTNSVQESVEETRKSVESVRDRVDELEQEVFEKDADGDDPEEGADDDLDAEEVEEVAADAAEKAVEKAFRETFEVPEDEDGDLSEVVRKGEKFPDPGHDEGDEDSIELDYSGVVAGEEAD